jgi:hypothetical protein
MKRITSQNLATVLQKVAPLALVFMCLTVQAVSSWATDNIVATSVNSRCAFSDIPGQSLPGAVFVQVTSNFGNQLVYYFTNANTGQLFQFNVGVCDGLSIASRYLHSSDQEFTGSTGTRASVVGDIHRNRKSLPMEPTSPAAYLSNSALHKASCGDERLVDA